MKKKKVNPYDALHENLLSALLGVEGIEKLLEIPLGERYLQLIATKQYELNGLVELYRRIILPSVNRNMIEQERLIRSSKYQTFRSLNRDTLREDHYEVIRLAYVQLHSKYEGFLAQLLPLTDELFAASIRQWEPIKTYLLKEHKLDLGRRNIDPALYEVSWVANCVKHTDGLPKRKPIPQRFKHLDSTLMIRIDQREAFEDFGKIRDLMAKLVTFVLGAHQHRLTREVIMLSSAEDLLRNLQRHVDFARPFLKTLAEFKGCYTTLAANPEKEVNTA